MQNMRGPEQESAEDIFFGQLVIIWARWFLILTGVVITFWTVQSSEELSYSLLPIVALMIMNFFLHGRYMMERPANQLLIAITSTLDLVIISVIVFNWAGSQGLENHYFIFYFPTVLGFCFVFPHRYSIIYTSVALVAYAAICYLVEPSIINNSGEMKLLIVRLLTLAATGGLAMYYWRIQRNRRRESAASAAG